MTGVRFVRGRPGTARCVICGQMVPVSGSLLNGYQLADHYPDRPVSVSTLEWLPCSGSQRPVPVPPGVLDPLARTPEPAGGDRL